MRTGRGVSHARCNRSITDVGGDRGDSRNRCSFRPTPDRRASYRVREGRSPRADTALGVGRLHRRGYRLSQSLRPGEVRMAHRRFGYVRKLPSGRFQASYLAPNGHRRNAPSTFATKTDAREWLVRVRGSILDGRWRDPVLARQPLIAYARSWIDQRPGLRPRTVDLYRWLLNRHLEPHFARMELGDITPLAVRRWRAALLDAGVSETMAAKSYRLLRAVLNTAVDDDILDRNPCRIRSGGDEKPAERPTLTVEQVQALSLIMPPRFSAFVMVATYGCLRWGEITALTRGDIDVDGGAITVRFAYVERYN